VRNIHQLIVEWTVDVPAEAETKIKQTF